MTEPQQSANRTTKSQAFRGIWPALLTPLNADLSIAHTHFATHCKTLIASGCPGVTAFGTTGEGPSFSMAERKEAVE
ncbi:MAG: dihydrodipicolinate synthase family protein, partial [Polaromonas sp.]